MQSPVAKQAFSISEDQVQTLAEKDWVMIDALIPADNVTQIKNLALQHWKDQTFSEAQIGRGSERQKVSSIRGDSICWLDQPPELIADMLQDLQNQLNEKLWLGLNHFEIHFARYAENAGYEAHIDQSPRSHPLLGQRVISFILYLNESWQKNHGGELCIHQESPLMIEPLWGRVVLFKSDKVLHSVMPSKAERWSLTGWFRKL